MKIIGTGAALLLWGAMVGNGLAAGTVSGKVEDMAGAPVVNSFVKVRDAGRRLAISVLTDRKGQYRIRDIPAGTYSLTAQRYGFDVEGIEGVEVGKGKVKRSLKLTPSDDLRLHLAGNAWLGALPAEPMKFTFITGCTICHDMGSPIAGQTRDFDGWVDIIEMMRNQSDIYSVIVDFETRDLASWLVENEFGENPLPLDPFASGKNYVTKAQIWEYEVGDAASWAHDMAVEPATGAAWVGDYINDTLIRIDPDTGDQKIIPLPVKHSGIHTLNFDRDGRLWFTLQLSGQVGVFNPENGGFRIFDGFGEGALTHSFAYDGEGYVQKDEAGLIWVSQFGTNSIASLDPVNGAVKVYPLGGDAKRPYGIALSSDGRLWYTKYPENLMGVLDPATGKTEEWALPRPDSGPHRIHIDSRDHLWIPLSGYGTLLRYDTATGESKEYLLPDADTFPYAVRFDEPSNSVWVNGNGANALYRLDLQTDAFEVYRLPSSISYTRMVSIDHERDRVWTALSGYPNGHALRDYGIVLRVDMPEKGVAAKRK